MHAEFVKSGPADGGVMLEGKAEVARLVQSGACSGILPEDLILRGGGKTGHKRWGNAHTKERMVAIVPILIDAGGPQTGLFHGRVVTANAIQWSERCWQRSHIDPCGRASSTIVYWLPGGATYRNRELRPGPRMQETAGSTSGHRAKINPIQGDAGGRTHEDGVIHT